MECPFCAETIRTEAIVCKHCSRDLRVVRPILLEIDDIITSIEELRLELDRVNARLERHEHPVRYLASHAGLYVLIPVVLLLLAHVLVTIVLDISPFPLRLASVIIPLLFGLGAYRLNRIGMRGALWLAAATAILAVGSMLTVTGLHDGVPIFPNSWFEWREVIEYGASIFLAFVCGNILSVLLFRILPRALAQGDKPNAFAFRLARLLGHHVGEEQLRRRARLIQHLMQTAGPLIGVAATAVGSLYTGLKGILG